MPAAKPTKFVGLHFVQPNLPSYVGEEDAGVWVHSTGCRIEDAAASADQAATLNSASQVPPQLLNTKVETTCFDGDTAVLVRVDDEMPPGMRGYVATPVSYLDFGPHSYCNIEYIRPGAKVLSRCEATGEVAYKKVVNVFERWYQGDMYYLCVKGRFEQGIVIDVTGNHPIWVVGKGWIEARELIEGDELYSADGKPVRAISLKKIDHSNEFVVYNLEVEGFNTYFASAEYILVHNCNLQLGRLR